MQLNDASAPLHPGGGVGPASPTYLITHVENSIAYNPPQLPSATPPHIDHPEKPLICNFFQTASQKAPWPSGDERDDEYSDLWNTAVNQPPWSSTQSPSQGSFPSPVTHPLELFLLTPTVKETPRYSRRSGRVLNESESLQEKHASEYRFLVPRLAYAIERTVASHDYLRKRFGLEVAICRSTAVSPQGRLGDSVAPHCLSHEKTNSMAVEEEEAVGPGSFSSRGESATPLAMHLQMNLFTTHDIPSISVHDYLKRIVKYTYVSPSVLLCACIYLDRLLLQHPSMLLHPYNIFKFLVTSMRVCSKVLDTRTLNNRDFSLVGGVANEELNELEFAFVRLLDNDLYISSETFNIYCGPLRRQAAKKEEPAVATKGVELLHRPTEPSVSREDRPLSLHVPSRPSPKRLNGNLCSRRLSISSQCGSSILGTSQSGMSPLRSASRPALPPSNSTSMDGDVFNSAWSRAGSTCPTHARRYSISGSIPVISATPAAAAGTTTTVSTVLPQVSYALNPLSARVTGKTEDGAATPTPTTTTTTTATAAAHNVNGLSFSHTGELADDGNERSRSLPSSAQRGGQASWDTMAKSIRCSNPSSGSFAPSSSPGVVPCTAQPPVAMEEPGAGAVVDIGLSKRALAYTLRDGVTLPPVGLPSPHGAVVSGRRGRSASLSGGTGSMHQVPLPPEQRWV